MIALLPMVNVMMVTYNLVMVVINFVMSKMVIIVRLTLLPQMFQGDLIVY